MANQTARHVPQVSLQVKEIENIGDLTPGSKKPQYPPLNIKLFLSLTYQNNKT